MKKPFPKSKSEKDFVDFFEKTDLGDYLEAKDLVRAQFHLKKQDRVVTFRISSDLLETLKKAAEKHRVQYQRLIRFILEENVAHYLR